MTGRGRLLRDRLLRGLATLLVLTLTTAVLADRETAEFFTERGEKALKAGNTDLAVEQFRRALDEDAEFYPAKFGLARTFLTGEKRADGITELRELAHVLRGADASKEWRSLLKDVQKLAAQVDAAGSELSGVVDAHVESLVAFARRWRKKDAVIAARALRLALELRPADEDAAKLIEALGQSAKGPPKSLFNGHSLDGWVDMGPPTFVVDGGAIVGTVKDSARMGRCVGVFEGDFDVRLEMRLVEEYSGPTFYAVAPAYDGKDGHYTLGVLKGRLLFQEDVDPDNEREFASVSPPNDFNEKEWHVYELRFRGDLVTALVDGKEIGADGERPSFRKGGFIGLKTQNCKAAYRNIQVIPR